MVADAREAGVDPFEGEAEGPEGAEGFGQPEAALTHAVDVSDWLAVKRASMRAHASQIAESSFFLAMPDDVFARAFGTEWFTRRGVERPVTTFAPWLEGLRERHRRSWRAGLLRGGRGGCGGERATAGGPLRRARAPRRGGRRLGRRRRSRAVRPGRAQAARAAVDLAALTGTPVVASPLRRTRETAAPIAAALGVDVVVDAAVGEVVAPPPFAALDQRGPWLRGFMAGRWADAGADLEAWRAGVVSALEALPGDTVVVTHFVAINAAVGAALGDDRVVTFRPGNCSRTVLRIGADGTTVARLGDEADTVVT
jgi:broad specificity phosphatase PhoE